MTEKTPTSDVNYQVGLMRLIDSFRRRVKESDHKEWQVYLLMASLLIVTGLVFDLGPVTTVLRSLEGAASSLEWVVTLALQGIVIGFAGEKFYEQGDKYAKTGGTNSMDTKDTTLGYRVGVMTAVSAIVTIVVPIIIKKFTEYLVIQTFGAVILLGILLVHEGSSEWNRSTEWPALVAGGLLAVAPSLL